MLGLLYALTMFVGAALLFIVQPMVARMLLPKLGGSPAVWTTCVVFYQAALLAGYVYAHLTARLAVRRQAMVHLAVLVVAFAALPIAIAPGWEPPPDGSPVARVLTLLAAAIGLPFAAVSATSPVLQRWFAASGARGADDPYFLYVASNLGSMLALLAYPLVVEPLLPLHDQSRLWSGGYALLVLLTATSAVAVWRGRDVPSTAAPAPNVPSVRRARWVALAFVPSSLMLAVTTYLSNEIEPMPLLWVIPLAIYLLTFTLVFARHPPVPHRLMLRALPIAVLPLVIVLTKQANRPVVLIMAVHLVVFFVVAMACHGELAADRPPAARLTEFYFWLALGGVLGGAFNAVVAPLVFASTAEYPLTLVLGCLLVPGLFPTSAGDMARDLGLPVALGATAAVLASVLPLHGPLGSVVVSGVPAFVCFAFSRRPVRFAMGVAALFLAGAVDTGQTTVLVRERSFYGIHRVVVDADSAARLLLHGTTLHGMQAIDGARRREPLAYYHPAGPLGQLFASLDSARRRRAVAVVGLGAGSVACYAEPGQRWDFYEIDPTVTHIARDPRYFTYLADCAPDATITLGDARLSLARATATYDLVILDAYSSDAIPVHLLTREAIALYLAHLRPGGILAFHIS
ncbi:MAG TPA: fused MFS/spermidine synthase, partial [Candidatus Binatia bacterium]|nr:fused MFS/spermidine synthase [Candidatus Binatia bacterium]